MLAAGDIEPRVRELCQQLAAAGHRAYIVGGVVRDLALRGATAPHPAKPGEPPWQAVKDWDVATSAPPTEVLKLFRHTIPTGLQHGTVTVMLGTLPVEVTSFRGDGAYSDGRRPDQVTFVKTIEEDLARRDFTINAIAFDPLDGRVVDPYGGRTDLAAGLIRAVGDPVARFREDGLRTMRAVRFAAVLEFALDPPTQAAIPQALDVFRKVSPERVRDELVKMLAARRPSIGLRLMRDTGLLAEVLPELTKGVGLHQNRHHSFDVFEHTVHAVDGTEGDAITRMGALLHDVAKPVTAAPKEDAPGEHTFYRHEHVGAEMAETIMRRLKFSNEERQRVVAVVAHHMFWYSPEWTDGTVRRFMRRVGTETLPDLFAVRAGDVVGRGKGEDPDRELGELKQRIHQVVEADQALKPSDLAIDGKDVMAALGIPPSRRVGEVLEALLERVLDDPALNERERLLALLPEVAAAPAASKENGQ